MTIRKVGQIFREGQVWSCDGISWRVARVDERRDSFGMPSWEIVLFRTKPTPDKTRNVFAFWPHRPDLKPAGFELTMEPLTSGEQLDRLVGHTEEEGQKPAGVGNLPGPGNLGVGGDKPDNNANNGNKD